MSLARAERTVPGGSSQGDRGRRFGAGDSSRSQRRGTPSTRTTRGGPRIRWSWSARAQEAIALLLGGPPAAQPDGSMFGHSRTRAAEPAADRPADHRLRPAHRGLGRPIGARCRRSSTTSCAACWRMSATPSRSRTCTTMSGGTSTSATAPTCSRWSSGCVASSVTSAARSQIMAVRGVGLRLVDRTSLARRAPPEIPRLVTWTSTPRTTRASPGSPRARCRSRSPTRRPTRARCSSRRGPATTTASRSRCSRS